MCRTIHHSDLDGRSIDPDGRSLTLLAVIANEARLAEDSGRLGTRGCTQTSIIFGRGERIPSLLAVIGVEVVGGPASRGLVSENGSGLCSAREQ